MIVKDFLLKFDIDDLVKAYCLYENDICNCHGTGNRKFHKNEFEVKRAFEKILSLEPIIDENCIIFSIPELGTQCLDSFLIYKDELFNDELDRIEHYGYEFCSMREILGYQISDACKFQLNDDLQYACSIIFEMTFFGYDPEEQEEEINDAKDDIDDSIEDIQENGTENYTSFNDILNSFDLTDKRSQKEIQFEDRMRSFWCDYYNNMMEELYQLERYYQNRDK